jgi:threonine dehydratase
MPTEPTLADFRRVRARIQPHIRSTPLVPSEVPGLFLKLENLQPTHSFKVRGAFARVSALPARGGRTLLTVSAGNHGQALARAAAAYGWPCTVVVPVSTPANKIEAIAGYGVDLRIEGANYDEAEEITLGLARDTEHYLFVSPYNDPAVILGQGSLAFEILEQMPQVSNILVPIGGGGLAAGVGAVLRRLRPSVRLTGVQAEVSAPVYHGLRAGRLVRVPDQPSVADGIAGNIDLESITFPLIQRYVHEVVLVSENEIRAAMKHLLQREKLVAEGAGAAPVAAVMAGKVQMQGPAAAVITGGNVDLDGMTGAFGG